MANISLCFTDVSLQVMLLYFRTQKLKKQTAKGGKKKKQVQKFTLDCTHPVEDGIMDAANFVREK